jgi:GT2 family glycosyltransferase
VRVVIVILRVDAVLLRCLEALRGQTDGGFEAIIVANGADPGPARALVADDARFCVLALAENLGFAAGCNRGAALQAGRPTPPFLAMLNPDAFAAPDWLAALRAATGRHPDAAAFASLQRRDADPAVADGLGDEMAPVGLAWRGGEGRPVPPPEGLREGPCFSACGAAALYRRDAWEAAGGFDEAYFCYLEDVDLGARLRLLGHGVVFVPTAQVRHVGGGGAGASRAFIRTHTARNRVRLVVVTLPGPLLALMAVPFVLALGLLLVRALVRGEGRAEAAGLRDGLRGLPASWNRRRAVQAVRAVAPWTFARALTWDVRRYGRRAPHPGRVRPP